MFVHQALSTPLSVPISCLYRQVLFHGAVHDMVPYFARLGYQCPQHFNPADFLFMEILHAGMWLCTCTGQLPFSHPQAEVIAWAACAPDG